MGDNMGGYVLLFLALVWFVYLAVSWIRQAISDHRAMKERETRARKVMDTWISQGYID